MVKAATRSAQRSGLLAAVLVCAVAVTTLMAGCSSVPDPVPEPVPDPDRRALSGKIPTDKVRRLVAVATVEPRAGVRTLLTGRVRVAAAPRALLAAQIRCEDSQGEWHSSTFSTTNTDPARTTLASVTWLVPEISGTLRCGLYGHAGLPPDVAVQNLSVAGAETRLTARTVQSAFELPVEGRDVKPGAGAALVAQRVPVPAGATRVEVVSGVQVSTFGDGDQKTPPDAHGELVTAITGTKGSCTVALSSVAPGSVTAHQHHLKWHGSTRQVIDAEACPELSARVGLRLFHEGPVRIEGSRYSSVLIAFD